ncbi:MAG: hypothetical protein ACK4YK_02325 [Dolichospermum sp.]|jgi:putative cell wall-binding protein
MNKFKSILLGSLLAATSITAFSQNSHAAEVQRQHDNFNPDIIAFDNTQPLSEHQIREQRERGQRARELRERQSHEQQIREQRARELRERQSREQQW